jgi:hypothetical protein
VTFLLCSKLFGLPANHPSAPRLRPSIVCQQRNLATAVAAEFG